MSKNTRSAIVPKAWATFSDALDEASTIAARKIMDDVREVIAREFPRSGHADSIIEKLDSAPVYARMAEIVENEVKNAICERFAFVEPEDE